MSAIDTLFDHIRTMTASNSDLLVTVEGKRDAHTAVFQGLYNPEWPIDDQLDELIDAALKDVEGDPRLDKYVEYAWGDLCGHPTRDLSEQKQHVLRDIGEGRAHLYALSQFVADQDLSQPLAKRVGVRLAVDDQWRVRISDGERSYRLATVLTDLSPAELSDATELVVEGSEPKRFASVKEALEAAIEQAKAIDGEKLYALRAENYDLKRRTADLAQRDRIHTAQEQARYLRSRGRHADQLDNSVSNW